MKKITALFITALAFTYAYAQKLPNKQETSVRIPANVKIDGKADEWGNKFEARNYTTDLYYTMANNNEDLYLIIQTKDKYAFKKIIDRGLTLSVNSPKGGKDLNFTFPYNAGRKDISLSLKGNTIYMTRTVSDNDVADNNKILGQNHKLIKVEGVEGVDSLVSVYNEIGLQAAELIDDSKAYTLEMAVKLKLLGLASNDGRKISYKIKVNAIGSKAPTLDNVFMVGPAGKTEIPPEMRAQAMADVTEKWVKMDGGTELQGEYTLVK